MSAALSLVLRSIDSLTADERAQWNAWVDADPDQGSPFFRVEYALLAGPHCPKSGLAEFRRGEEVVGYFPFQKRGGTIQPLGAPMNDYHGIIGPIAQRPGLEEAAALMGAPCFGVSAWIGEARNLHSQPSYRAVIAPAVNYEQWYAERRKAHPKYFKDKERARRSLEADFGPMQVDIDCRDPEILEVLLGLKSAQYVRSGLHDIFACGWTVELLKALLASEYPDFGARLCLLYAGDRLCALEYSLCAGERFHFWFPAYYAEASRFSPGILLSMETIRLMSEMGFTEFDYGCGSDGYKRYFCETVQMVGEGWVRKSGLRSASKMGAKALLKTVGQERGQKLVDRVRRRWNVIEACEVSLTGRAKGIVLAARSAVNKRD